MDRKGNSVGLVSISLFAIFNIMALDFFLCKLSQNVKNVRSWLKQQKKEEDKNAIISNALFETSMS